LLRNRPQVRRVFGQSINPLRIKNPTSHEAAGQRAGGRRHKLVIGKCSAGRGHPHL